MTTATMNRTSVVNKSGADMSVGEKRGDGTLYLGRHPDPKDGVEKHFFTMSQDLKDKVGERLSLNFNQLSELVKKCDAHGHNDWKPAADDIAVVQFDARSTGDFANAAHAYDYNRAFPRSRYLTGSVSPQNPDKAIARSFVDGKQELIDKGFVGYARLVRTEPC